MDPNTNTPTDPNEPQPLGGPLHPPESSSPAVSSPQDSTLPDPSQFFTPSSPPAPLQPPTAPTPPSDVITPVQSPAAATFASAPQPPQPGPGVIPAGPAAGPTAPVIVSGGFAPNNPVAPVVGTVSPAFSPTGQAPLPPPSGSKARGLKPMLVALAAIIVVAGGSAAAYIGVIAPNQPANVLKAAIVNTLKQNSLSYTGTISLTYQGGGGAGGTYQLDMSGSKNSAQKASDVMLSFDGYGVKLSIEARIVNQNLYVKAGDLSTLASLVSSFEPSLAPTASAISGDLSNQWVEVDSATLNEIGVGCVINAASGPLTQADLNALTSDYAKNGFLKIQKTTNTTVDGQAAEEFAVNIDDNKGASFISGMGSLSSVKALEACQGGSTLGSSLKQVKGDGKQTPLTLWVSKGSKQIIEVSASDTPQEISQTHAKGTVDVKFKYNNVSIPAPANAESYLQLYTKLAPTLQSLSSSGLDLSGLSSSL